MSASEEEVKEFNCVIIFFNKTISGSLLKQMTRGWGEKNCFKRSWTKKERKTWARLSQNGRRDYRKHSSIDDSANTFGFFIFIIKHLERISVALENYGLRQFIIRSEFTASLSWLSGWGVKWFRPKLVQLDYQLCVGIMDSQFDSFVWYFNSPHSRNIEIITNVYRQNTFHQRVDR